MIYFNTTTPMLITNEEGFDSYPVIVDEEWANKIQGVATLLEEMKLTIDESGAPEDWAQPLAAEYMSKFREIFDA